MSRCRQMKIIICINIFFVLFNAIQSKKPSYLLNNEVIYEPEVQNTETSESDAFSRVHELMTKSERYHTFGSTVGPLPPYKVFKWKSPPLRQKRETDDPMLITVEIDGRTVVLMLKPTDGHVATKNIPVWLASSDQKASQGIRYDPYEEPMKFIEKFQMYQDLHNKAAITVFTDSENHSTLQGIVTSKYAIKSLPERLTNQLIKITNSTEHFVRTDGSNAKPRTFKSHDGDYYTGHVVLFKSEGNKPDPIRLLKSMSPQARSSRKSPKNSKRTVPQIVYPELLLVLENDATRHQTVDQAMQFVLAFWNGVDMYYSAIKKPKIRLHISGMIFAMDDTATPYIAKDTSFNIIAKASNIVSKIGNHFYNDADRFPRNRYDIVFAMTTIKLCGENLHDCDGFSGFAELSGACNWRHKVGLTTTSRSVGIVNYNTSFGGVLGAVQHTAHLFGVPHNETEFKLQQNAMGQKTYTWSRNSKESIRHFFSLKSSMCLDNEPVALNPTADPILPGQWMTLNGQCQNNGFHETCQNPGFQTSPCVTQTCRASSIDECVPTEISPFEGTECGVNRYCRKVNYIPTCV